MSNGKILWQGKSEIDGQDIVVIGLKTSSNVKTGNMLQSYIIRSDIDPRIASATGKDYSICGNCPHRGKPSASSLDNVQYNATGGVKLALERSCYVKLGQGPTIVYKAFKRGSYKELDTLDSVTEFGKNLFIRLGTYGDPKAVPEHVWQALTKESKGHTGYTHQTIYNDSFDKTHKIAQAYNSRYMISADNLNEAKQAWKDGFRTFRVIETTDDLHSKELLCPASKEAINTRQLAGNMSSITCAECRLCDGISGNNSTKKSVAIVAHGSGKKHAKQRINIAQIA